MVRGLGPGFCRRWHRYKDKSGGLLVHRSTHHFDLMNWWVDSTPVTVAANGRDGAEESLSLIHI